MSTHYLEGKTPKDFKKVALALALLTSYSYAIQVVVTIDSLKTVIGSIFSASEVRVLLPPFTSPLIWKPTPKEINEAIKADIFIQTSHWPFEVQIAEKRAEFGKGNIPDVTSFDNPALEIQSHGFVVLRVANVGLDPHGWWLYVPNAELIMSKSVALACKIDPINCKHYIENLYSEFKEINAILSDCVRRLRGLKAVTILPGEAYPIMNFGVEVSYVLQVKGIYTSLAELYKLDQILKRADFVVISEFSEKLPITKFVIREVRKLGIPFVKINILWDTPNTYSSYLRTICKELSKVR